MPDGLCVRGLGDLSAFMRPGLMICQKSLQAYALVFQNKPRIEAFQWTRRQSDEERNASGQS